MPATSDGSSSRPIIDFTPIALKAGALVADRFEVRATLGRGNASIVYRALDRADHVEVALKLLVPRVGVDRELSLRLLRELRLATEIFHPRFVNIRNADEWNGSIYMAMEVVEGRILKDDVDRRGALQRGAAVKAVYDTALALRALAKERISHRNVWPRNLVIEPNLDIKVMDFAGSRVRAILGKLETVEHACYLAPEECDPKLHGDSRADVYNLGVMLFELITGRCPFPIDLAAAALKDHKRPAPHDLRQLQPNTPDWIVQIIGRALSLSPADRYPDIEAFVQDLEATATESQISEDVEGVIHDIERKAKARAEREAAFALEAVLPPLELPEEEARRRAKVKAADFSPAAMREQRRTWLKAAGIIVGAVALAVVLGLLLRPHGDRAATNRGSGGPAAISLDEKIRLSLDGLRDGFPGDDAGHLEDLVKMGAAALPRLEQATTDSDPVVRRHVALALGRIDADGTRATIEPLVGDVDAGVREAALQALSHATVVAPEIVRPALESSSRNEQKLALGLIAKGVCASPAADVVTLVYSDDDSVRVVAARALGKVSGSEAPAALIKALADPSSLVREEAARSLAAFPSEATAQALLPTLFDPAPGVAAAAATSLSGSLSPSLAATLETQATQAITKGEGAYLVVALIKAGNDSVAAAVRGRVSSAVPADRAYAAEVLGAVGDPAALTLLESALAERTTRFAQRPLLVAAARLGSKPHMDRLLDALRSPLKSRITFAASALAEVGNPAAIPALEKVMDERQDPELRPYFVSALARLGSFSKGQYEELLMSENIDGRRQAVAVFGLAQDTSRMSRILEIRNREADNERVLLFDVSLGRLGHRPTLDYYRKLAREGGPVDRERAARFFGELGRHEHLPIVMPLLVDDRPEVRTQACLAAAAMYAPHALPAIEALFADPDPRVRQAAAYAMYRLGDETVVNRVTKELESNDPMVRAEACKKLETMGTTLALPSLLPRLSDMDRYAGPQRRSPDAESAGKDEIYPRVVDAAVAAVEAVSGFKSGFSPWALDEDQALTLDKLQSHIRAHADELVFSELL